jgi:EAL domain-containing protein (putative c-di-GMP-specific phosphodiesterase class I)/GGDEF domain-containing protein
LIQKIESFLSYMFEDKIEILKAGSFEKRDGVRYIPIDQDFVLSHLKTEIDSTKLYHTKIVLTDFFKEYKHLQKSSKEGELVKHGLKNSIISNIQYLKREQLSDFFSFLEEFSQKYALLENSSIVFNINLDKFTLDITNKKLSKKEEISLPVKGGELYGYKDRFYSFIIESENKLDNFVKLIIKSRLFWLNSFYEKKSHYETDSLTKLYSKNRFIYDVEIKFKSLGQKVFILNVKRFGIFNELYGSKFGDSILVFISEKLKLNHPNSLIYRIEADKFGFIFLEEVEDSSVSDISKELKEFYIFNENTKEYVGVSIELKFLIFHSIPDDILHKIDYSFKNSDKKFINYERDIRELFDTQTDHLKQLITVLENGGITPYFQKIVDKSSEKIVYYEVLMRIKYGKKIVSPSNFLNIARKKGYYTKINLIMVEKSIELAYKHGLKISLNIDILDILNIEFLKKIEKLLSGRETSMIQFEILETEDIYENYKQVEEFISKIKALGCTTALDDFGSGYSNFSVMKNLQIDTLKIDMSLIKDVSKDNKSLKMLEAIVNFAKIMDLKVTLEGVENREILNKLQDIKADYLQGYYFSKPLPIEKLIEN